MSNKSDVTISELSHRIVSKMLCEVEDLYKTDKEAFLMYAPEVIKATADYLQYILD